LAYCHGDAPPKHLKKYELIKQRKRDDIKKFSNLIRKDLANLTKIPEDKQCNILNPYCHSNNALGGNTLDKKGIIIDEKKILKKLNNNDTYMNNDLSKKNSNVNMKIELTNSEKKNLINAIREMLIDESNLTLEINSEDFSIKQNTNITLTYEDITYPEKFSWVFLKESQEYLNGISTFETFKLYRSIITNKFDFAKNILKEKINVETKKKTKQKIKKEIKYCKCGASGDNNWIGCDSGDRRCPGKGWYHISCLDELKGYDIKSFEKKFSKYYCPNCRERLGLKNELNDNEEKNNNDTLEEKKKNEIEYVNINNNNSNDNNIKGDDSLNKMEIEEEKINNEKNENKDIMKDN